MTFIRTPPQISNITEHAEPEALRRAIDLVATLRARVLRVGLFGTLLYRPDPGMPTDPAQRTREMDILREQVETITAVISALNGNGALPDTPQIISDWIASNAARMPLTMASVQKLDPLSRDVLTAAQTGSTDQRAALARHMQTARAGFYEAVTALCDALWDDLAIQHTIALERATAAATTLGERLSRLERIGKHVRLVSLNASVEAARAGDVGKGLMVIANEFKTLAEEIQTLAQDSRDDIVRIS